MTGRPSDINIDTSDIDALLSGVGRRNQAEVADERAVDGKTVKRQNGKTAATRSKFTVLLDEEDALAFDMLAYEMRATAGRRVEKAEVLRTLINLATTNVAMHDILTKAFNRRPSVPDQTPQD